MHWGLKAIGGLLLVVAVAVLLDDDGRTAGPPGATSAEGSTSSPVASARTTAPEQPQGTPPSRGTTPEPRLAAAATPSAAPRQPTPTIRTYRVTQVVDGDTIVIEGGARVRLIGIDAPERDACGSAEATRLLRSYALGKDVILPGGAQTDKDRYGRLLRYVDLGRSDIGLKMIQSGRAIARYDSRDGYGPHPRENTYVRADAASADTSGCAPVRLVPDPAPGTPDVYYANCAAARAAGAAPLLVGEPGYRSGLDGDKDGVACER